MIRRLELKKEIAFSPSTQGSLKVAQYTGIGEYPKAWLLSEEKDYGLPSEQIKKHNEKEIEKWNNSRPIGGKSSDILCFEYDLAFGDISEKIPGDKRYQYLHESISKMYPADKHGNLADEWVSDLKKKNQKYLRELRKALKEGASIRIWYSSAPDELNAFYWLMSFLDKQKYYTKVSAVYIPPNYWLGRSFYRGTGMLEPEHYFGALSLEKDLSEGQIKAYSERWKELQKENSSMRLMVSGNLVSLPEDFLDSFIYTEMSKLPDSFTIAMLVGNVMGEYELMVGDRPLFERVMHIIQNGDLTIIEDWAERPMMTMVRKINERVK